MDTKHKYNYKYLKPKNWFKGKNNMNNIKEIKNTKQIQNLFMNWKTNFLICLCASGLLEGQDSFTSTSLNN